MEKNNLVLEFITQEVPASSQADATHSFLNFFTQTLITSGAQLEHPNASCAIDIAPRVMVLTCNNFVINPACLIKEIRGPKLQVKNDIVQAFARKYNTNIAGLIADENKGHYFYRELMGKEQWASQIVTHMLLHYRWPKAMRWGDSQISWIRPLVSLNCYLNDHSVALNPLIPSSTIQIYHRQLDGPRATALNTSIKQRYLENGIVLSREQRKTLILDQFAALGFTHNDDELLETVVGLVEYPRVVEIDDVFIDILPFEIVNVALKHHQKAFCAINQKSTNHVKVFVVVNRCIDSSLDQIITGYRRVIDARIADAIYLLKKDLRDLASGKIRDRAKNSLINPKIGTIYQQSQRINAIAQALLEQNDRDFMDFKLDYGSAITEEFIELRGFYSFFLLKHECISANNKLAGEQQERHDEREVDLSHHFTVMRRIKDFDRLEYEKSIFSEFYFIESLGEHNILYPLLDKFDYLVGLLLFDYKVTGSADPYQMRRVAKIILGVFIKYDEICNLRLWDYILIFVFAYNTKHFTTQIITESKVKEIRDFILARSDNQHLIDAAPYYPRDFCLRSASLDPFLSDESKRTQFKNVSASLRKRISNLLEQVDYHNNHETDIAQVAQILEDQVQLLSAFLQPALIKQTKAMLISLKQIQDRTDIKYSTYLEDLKHVGMEKESFARHIAQISRSSIKQDYLPHYIILHLMLETQNLLDNVKIMDQEQNTKIALSHFLFAQQCLIK